MLHFYRCILEFILDSIYALLKYSHTCFEICTWWSSAQFLVTICHYDIEIVRGIVLLFLSAKWNVYKRKGKRLPKKLTGAFSWTSKTAQFTIDIEAEYVLASWETSQAIWLERILMHGKKWIATLISCDNKFATMTKDLVYHRWTIHIAIKHPFLQELWKMKRFNLSTVLLEIKWHFTKALSKKKFQYTTGKC